MFFKSLEEIRDFQISLHFVIHIKTWKPKLGPIFSVCFCWYFESNNIFHKWCFVVKLLLEFQRFLSTTQLIRKRCSQKKRFILTAKIFTFLPFFYFGESIDGSIDRGKMFKEPHQESKQHYWNLYDLWTMMFAKDFLTSSNKWTALKMYVVFCIWLSRLLCLRIICSEITDVGLHLKCLP